MDSDGCGGIGEKTEEEGRMEGNGSIGLGKGRIGMGRLLRWESGVEYCDRGERYV
jgi:hypothetical protein